MLENFEVAEQARGKKKGRKGGEKKRRGKKERIQENSPNAGIGPQGLQVYVFLHINNYVKTDEDYEKKLIDNHTKIFKVNDSMCRM